MRKGVYMADKFINIPMVTIYGLTDVDNVIKYIGVTRRKPSYRFNSHMFEARRYPEQNKRTKWISSSNFKIKQIILDEVPEEEWLFWESYWIELVKTWGFNLVNSNNGGGGLLKRGEEFSKWLSNRNKGNTYRLGKKHTEETKLIIREKMLGRESPNKGKKLPDEWVDKLRGKRNIDKIFFTECPSCGNEIGYSNEYLLNKSIEKKTLCRSCFQKGRKYSEESKLKMSEALKGKGNKIVTQMDLDGNFIKEWLLIDEAEKQLKIFGITKVCRGYRKTAGGYKWKYKK